jgi:hypothetical protein
MALVRFGFLALRFVNAVSRFVIATSRFATAAFRSLPLKTVYADGSGGSDGRGLLRRPCDGRGSLRAERHRLRER